MNCESYDWKAYALGELDTFPRAEAEAHAAACGNCREELALLRLTLDTLSTLRNEEVPRRIAFVSDKVFEPRWWRRFLNPNFAAACVIAIAILAHAIIVRTQIEAAVAQAEAKRAGQTDKILAGYVSQMIVTSTGLERQ